jgi:hypothetical protein
MPRIRADRGSASISAGGRGGRVSAIGGAAVSVATRAASVGSPSRGGIVRGVDRRSNVERIVKFGPQDGATEVFIGPLPEVARPAVGFEPTGDGFYDLKVNI